ncbi:MAG: QueT transporter family protein [Eubacteriales bacterium]|nr:QueT transporter family protein [Eubacteriales bacterium]
MKKITVRQLTVAAMVGAAYAVLSIFGSIFGISYGPIQCRFSEALCVLPFLFPETAWGLGVGCLIANILSPYGLLDIIVGSLTTLIAALLTARCRNRYLSPLPPVLLNGVLVGGIITFQQVDFSHAFALTYLLNFLSVTLGEAIACYGLGLPLLRTLEKKYHR